MAHWESLEFPSACHAEDHGFKSRMGRLPESAGASPVVVLTS